SSGTRTLGARMRSCGTSKAGAARSTCWMHNCGRGRAMAIDEMLTRRVRAALAEAGPVREVKMFGGLGFMLNGNMVAAASHRGLLVRVGEAGMAEALERGAQPMLINGRKMKGFVWVPAAADARAVK